MSDLKSYINYFSIICPSYTKTVITSPNGAVREISRGIGGCPNNPIDGCCPFGGGGNITNSTTVYQAPPTPESTRLNGISMYKPYLDIGYTSPIFAWLPMQLATPAFSGNVIYQTDDINSVIMTVYSNCCANQNLELDTVITAGSISFTSTTTTTNICGIRNDSSESGCFGNFYNNTGYSEYGYNSRGITIKVNLDEPSEDCYINDLTNFFIENFNFLPKINKARLLYKNPSNLILPGYFGDETFNSVQNNFEIVFNSNIENSNSVLYDSGTDTFGEFAIDRCPLDRSRINGSAQLLVGKDTYAVGEIIYDSLNKNLPITKNGLPLIIQKDPLQKDIQLHFDVKAVKNTDLYQFSETQSSVNSVTTIRRNGTVYTDSAYRSFRTFVDNKYILNIAAPRITFNINTRLKTMQAYGTIYIKSTYQNSDTGFFRPKTYVTNKISLVDINSLYDTLYVLNSNGDAEIQVRLDV